MKKLVSLLLAALLLCACLPVQAADTDTLVVSLVSDPLSFNPDLAPDDASLIVCLNIFNNLISFDMFGTLVPDLAESWELSEDGLAYTLHLAEGVKWHDGEPFTSEDVRFTIEAIQGGGFSSAGLASIVAIETPDETTVILRTETPDASIPYNLAYYGASMLPKHRYQDGEDWTQSEVNMLPIGTGAFKFADYQPGVSITLEANPDYFRGAPNVGKVVYAITPDPTTASQALLNGEVDILGDYLLLPGDVPMYQANPDMRVTEVPFPGVNYMVMNLASEYTGDLAVRQAIALGVDRDAILKLAMQGQGTPEYGFMTPFMAWAYNDEAQAPLRDIGSAIAMLESAGYVRGADGYFFTLSMPVMSGGEYVDIGAVVQDNLREIGIQVTVNAYDIGAWMQMCIMDRNYDISVLGGNQGPDPSNFGMRVTSTGQLQFMNYNNPDLDACFAEGIAQMDTAKRAAAYKKAQAILAEDLPILSLTSGMVIEVAWEYVNHTSFTDAGVPLGRYHLVTIDR